MRKVLFLLVGTVVLWVPAVSIAGDASEPAAGTQKVALKNDASNPASTCKGLRNASDFGSGHRGQTFTQFYGTNRGKGHAAGSNAFGKCVARIAMHKTGDGGKDSEGSDHSDGAESHGNDGPESHSKSTANPAMTCRGMEASDLAHFKAAYGTRGNAFGKCVSSHATSDND